ncbi:glycosyl transferase family 1 [Mycolicibacterium celeriflavum]|uniref:glycosyltransferase n=1 Tax=Mycolicibacterium celeriflavum TaxID=1249101 RepID=UPI0007FF1141|nr:glycosyltransferase [Mycolicibacterium celeriflavum]OBG17973.1 glycosyl transferase family 1 [Mycolicibacterium celeriflavum]
MKVVVAAYGTRGDVEPSFAVGRELLRRGHEVCMAVPPDLMGLGESVGLDPTPYGPELETMLGAHRNFWTFFFRNFWRLREVKRLSDEAWEPRLQCWVEMSRTLTSLADGADLLFTGPVFEEVAANVAEYHDIPLATLHYFPLRANGQLLPVLPPAVGRSVMTVHEWMLWRGTRKVENEQRRELGLPNAATPSPRRVADRGSLEIQAYDEVCFPGLAAEWRKWGGRRPFVGALTLEMTTVADQEVASWIAAGKPPIFFGFGSMPVESATETLATINSACAELGERALVCSAGSEFDQIPESDDIKIVPTANFAEVFPMCRAVVHHGGAGTTAAGLRAGVPQLILSTDLDQTLWGARVKRLGVGAGRRFSTTTRDSLVADLSTVLTDGCATKARESATRMTTPASSVTAAADHIETFARSGTVG